MCGRCRWAPRQRLAVVVVVVVMVGAAAAGVVVAGDAAAASLLAAAVLVVNWTRIATTTMKQGRGNIVAGVSFKWTAAGGKSGRLAVKERK